MFNAEQVKNDIVQWIREWFEKNGPECNALVGVSAGKDSSIVAALCVEALGRDRVIGVLMPNGEQSDIDKAYQLVDFLNIRSMEINISLPYRLIITDLIAGAYEARENFLDFYVTDQTRINLAPRIRMATLYALSQSLNGRVSNNCNLSEEWVGYSTRWGDNVGDFAPLANLTVSEVKEIGYALGLPTELIEKAPSDGLCGMTDEDNLGFTYEALDRYIRTGVCEDRDVKERIDYLHKKNKFKLRPIPRFVYPAGMQYNPDFMDHW